MTTETSAAPLPVRATHRMGPRSAFALQAAISIAFLAASSAPTPLYAMYQSSMQLSKLLITVIFAAYSIALLVALLVVGALSDYVGRRTVIIAALILELAAMIVFAVAGSSTELIAARALQGLATGAATAALAAGLTDLFPAKAPVMNSVAPILGMAAGALGSAALTTVSTFPTIEVFIVLAVLFAVLLIAAFRLPETAARKPGALTSLAIRLTVPEAARGPLLTAAPMLVAIWAIGGFVLSLGPALVRAETGSDSPLVGGWFVFALTISGAIAVVVMRSVAPLKAFVIGGTALATGVGVLLLGVLSHQSVLLFIGAAIAGVGFGGGFQGAMRTIMPTAAPGERASPLATVYVISYLATSVPAIGAGMLASSWGMTATAITIGSAVIALALVALASVLMRPRTAPLPAPSTAYSTADIRRHDDRTALGSPAHRHAAIAATATHITTVIGTLRDLDLSDTPPSPTPITLENVR
ncbi:MFS transporter [Arthrobacter sp. 18067]|uniref:MFS transporter n=1 Tax=Arthrobacter sp. 18067 TaxID=2681413 RepID=UPI00135B226C|nr:MFS transporter [Arthrobacter sp. 18067]